MLILYFNVSDEETADYKSASFKFRQLFTIPAEEKLVTYYSTTYWKGRIPFQGWMYLTVHRLCFHSLIFGSETKIIIRWTDVTSLDKSNSLLLGDTIRIATRDNEVKGVGMGQKNLLRRKQLESVLVTLLGVVHLFLCLKLEIFKAYKSVIS